MLKVKSNYKNAVDKLLNSHQRHWKAYWFQQALDWAGRLSTLLMLSAIEYK